MVHHTMNTNNSSAPSASSNNKVMTTAPTRPWRRRHGILMACIVGTLAACGSVTLPPPEAPPSRPLAPPGPATGSPAPAVLDAPTGTPAVTPDSPAWRWADSQPLPAPLQRGKSTWQPVRWSELPGWGHDALHQAWNAWLRSCERPAPPLGPLCTEVRQLSIAGATEQHDWVMRRLQPYRVQAPQGEVPGLLTGYYEPMLDGRRQPGGTHQTPLYRLPAGVRLGQPWYTRQQMATDPAAQAQLQGQAIAWLADPLDALLLQIQGSGRLRVTEPDGSQRTVRLAYAGHNGHPYQSVMRWLLDRRLVREGTWEALRAWAAQNPERVDEMLWSNPRTVFFREEPLTGLDAQFGPRGAQGVALTPGRSIAVDRDSIPYGTPVWLATPGPVAQLRRLVLAQDTGSAIVGAVRADYFTGWGDEAYTLAAALKQPLQLWALWPRAQ
ncbi:murein transglycosylase A [Aquabacterium sp. A08]|uniref:murein transglycosylase A n=1 Tax=Aquabacterium sp. A08 TaxID=2718532 RepID=UPI0014208AE7|nr:MltA domain-containing protein [Aquabacterium sp. A08]NIC41571.1 transglycosylase [Aquabacterium sp. A08]